MKKIGEFAINHQGLEPLEVIVDQPINERAISKKSAKVICVDFTRNNNDSLNYNGVHTEDYDLSKLTKYLYRDHPSHRFRITPTDKISTLEKTFRRVVYWFRKFDEYLSYDLVNDLKNELIEENKIKERIFLDVERIYNSLGSDAKDNCILTFTFQTKKGQKYLGDFEIFTTILKEEGMNEFWASGVPLKPGTCYLCEEEKEVSRPREPFSFYTVNVRGFAQDFSVKDSWKQLPVCSDCTLMLEAGRNFMDVYLSKRFYGYRFYVLPAFIFGEIKEDIMQDIINLKEEKYEDSLLSEEYDLSYYMKDREDIVNLIFIFYEVKQGGENFDILKYIEDVPPSWIKKIINVFEDVNLKNIFNEESLREIFGRKWEGRFIKGVYKGEKRKYMTLGGMLREFFPSSKISGVHDKEFVDIVGNILSKQKFQEDILIKAFVREIRNSHANDNWNEKLLSLKSLYLLDTIKRLNLLDGSMNKKEGKTEKWSEQSKSEIERFFNDFSKVFNTSSKRAVFLEGVLTRFLLDIQSRERNSTPFRSKLRGLRLDENKIKILFPEITEKLRQYEAPYYSWLEEMISQCFIEADDSGWNINKNEISYYFALGLNLGRTFKRKKKNEGGGEDK